MRVLNFFISLVLLSLIILSPAYAQFREIERIELANIGVDDTYGIATNAEDRLIYVIHLRECRVAIYSDEWEELDHIQLEGSDFYGMDYNPEDNSWWFADYGDRNVYHYSLEGELLDQFASNCNVHGITYCAENGHIYLADWGQSLREMTVEGELLNTTNLEWGATSVEYYPPNNTLFAMSGSDFIDEFTLEGEFVAHVLEGDPIPNNGLGMDYNAMTRTFYTTWQGAGVVVWEDNYSAVPEPQFDVEEFNLEIPFPAEWEESLTITNVGEEGSILRFSLEVAGEGIDWLTCNPVSGVLDFEESTEVTLTVVSEDMEPGQFEKTLIVNSNNPDFSEVEIPVNITIIAGFGELTGVILDAATNSPVEGVHIELLGFRDYHTDTDENGEYSMEVCAWIHTVAITAEDYLPQTFAEIEIIEDETTELNTNLLHSICDLSVNAIAENLPPDDVTNFNVTLRNTGNGPLTWCVEREFPEGMNVDPWTHRAHFPVSNVVDNTRLGGIEFVNDMFYVSGGIRGEDNPMYLLDREGNLVDQFPQFAESNYGMRDLTFDGELLWGIDGDFVYGFTPAGELQAEIESPMSPARTITWDPMNEILWVCNLTTDIVGITRDGEEVGFINRPAGGLRIYGMGWFPEDPDEYYMYLFCGNGELQNQIFKLNPDNGEVMFVAEPNIAGQAGGATVTNMWDPFSWVFIGLTRDDPDAIEVWHLAAPTAWVQIDPTEGVVDAENQADLTVTLDSEGLPINIEFEAEFVFSHDGVGGETRVPILLMATEGNVHTQRTLQFHMGWNMVSANVDPDEHDIVALTQSLVDDGLLDMMKNGTGNFYNPQFNFNNIPGWFVEQGYLMKVNESCELMLEGVSVMPDLPIALSDGWQMISYYPRSSIDAIVAFSGIADQLQIAKDGNGNFYVPAWGFSNMGDLREGQGYLVKIDGETELVYQLRDQAAAQYQESDPQSPVHFCAHKQTDNNMSLLILGDHDPVTGSEIAVYASGKLVGSCKLQEGMTGVAIWGDDFATEEIDGARPGERLELRIYSDEFENAFEFEAISGEGVYQTNGLWVIRSIDNNQLPAAFGISSVYPNPFNSTTRINYSLRQDGRFKLGLYDINGRTSMNLLEGEGKTGYYSLNIDGAKLSSGIYFVKLEQSGQVTRTKIVLTK